MAIVKTLAKGQIVIPAHFRKKYNIKQGSELQIFEYGRVIYLVPPVENPVKTACGSLPKAPSLSKELLKERVRDFHP
ncbi:MAG: AbrB/MazE/SpoVT family DNA-binding domain-containing protein [Thermodesulfobacteriota bacterium]|nr:AbrB/MazE/SpoVT family DNA-binding domain-containing protein [Thermodesulfobacteriota bacterium]